MSAETALLVRGDGERERRRLLGHVCVCVCVRVFVPRPVFIHVLRDGRGRPAFIRTPALLPGSFFYCLCAGASMRRQRERACLPRPRWPPAAAVRDRGGTALNLPDRRSGRSPIDLHLPDTVTDGARRPIAASGDGQTLVHRWDEAGLTLSDWRAVTEPLGRHRTFSAPRGSAIMSRRE